MNPNGRGYNWHCEFQADGGADEGFLRPRQGSHPCHARLGPGENSRLERREDYRTRRPSLHRAAYRAAPRSADRLCSLGRRRPAVDTRPAPEELVLKRLATVNRCKQAITQNP